MQNLLSQQNSIPQSIKAQLKEFGLDPKDWTIKVRGFQIKVISKDSPSTIEFRGHLKNITSGPFQSLKIQSLELLPF